VVEDAPNPCYFWGVRIGIGAIVLLSLVAISSADIDNSEFESAGWRVRMSAPKNWQLTEQTSYPNVLLWMVRHGPDGKMLLSAEEVSTGDDALGYANRTSTLLEKMGFTMRAPQLHSATGAYWIDFDNGRVYLRQAFIVANSIGYALTLSASDSRTRSQHLRAFDYALRSIRPIRKQDSQSESKPSSDEAAGDSDADSSPPPEQNP
jgi:hypothetical protein